MCLSLDVLLISMLTTDDNGERTRGDHSNSLWTRELRRAEMLLWRYVVICQCLPTRVLL